MRLNDLAVVVGDLGDAIPARWIESPFENVALDRECARNLALAGSTGRMSTKSAPRECRGRFDGEDDRCAASRGGASGSIASLRL